MNTREPDIHEKKNMVDKLIHAITECYNDEYTIADNMVALQVSYCKLMAIMLSDANSEAVDKYLKTHGESITTVIRRNLDIMHVNGVTNE